MLLEHHPPTKKRKIAGEAEGVGRAEQEQGGAKGGVGWGGPNGNGACQSLSPPEATSPQSWTCDFTHVGPRRSLAE